MVWEEVHTGVPVTDGMIYTDLGSVDAVGNGLDESVFTGDDMWLEITIEGEVQSPRLRINSVPYAVRAATAETLGGLAPGDVALAGHDHDGVYAPDAHDHDGVYVPDSHNHDGVYAPDSHSHALDCMNVVESDDNTNTVNTRNLTASCPSGYRLVGGGCYTFPTSARLRETRPLSGTSTQTWYCRASTDTSVDITLSATAICCRL